MNTANRNPRPTHRAQNRFRSRRATVPRRTVRAVVPSSLVARLLKADASQILKLRGSGTAQTAFGPTAGSSTRDHVYSFDDLVRLAVVWRLRHFIGLKHRAQLWRSITKKQIESATNTGEQVFLSIEPCPGGRHRTGLVIRQLNFHRTSELPTVAAIVNLSALGENLQQEVNELIRLNLVEEAEETTAGLKERCSDLEKIRNQLSLMLLSSAGTLVRAPTGMHGDIAAMMEEHIRSLSENARHLATVEENLNRLKKQIKRQAKD